MSYCFLLLNILLEQSCTFNDLTETVYIKISTLSNVKWPIRFPFTIVNHIQHRHHSCNIF